MARQRGLRGAPGKMNHDNAYERAVLALRADPNLWPHVLGSFLDEDFEQAVSRYAQSDEFAQCWAILERHLQPGSRLLDLGAGRGLTSVALARRNVHVTSVEYDPSDVVGVGALANYRGRLGLPLCPVRGDALQLPFLNNTFDLAFARTVLHHLADLGKGLKEIWRVLKPGGIFVAYSEHILSPFSDGKKFLQAHPCVPFGVDERAYPVFKYWWKFRLAGFRPLRFFQYHFIMDFSEFVRRAKRRPPLAFLIETPAIGTLVTKLLYGLHFPLWRYPHYLVVPEEQLASVSIIARKPALRELG
jgi:SAM-dependent methyltransferase